jgi:hypothetical protein
METLTRPNSQPASACRRVVKRDRDRPPLKIAWAAARRTRWNSPVLTSPLSVYRQRGVADAHTSPRRGKALITWPAVIRLEWCRAAKSIVRGAVSVTAESSRSRSPRVGRVRIRLPSANASVSSAPARTHAPCSKRARTSQSRDARSTSRRSASSTPATAGLDVYLCLRSGLHRRGYPAVAGGAGGGALAPQARLGPGTRARYRACRSARRPLARRTGGPRRPRRTLTTGLPGSRAGSDDQDDD